MSAVDTASAPRVRPGSRGEIGLINGAVCWVAGRVAGTGPLNLFTTLARHRRLFRGWLWFAGGLMPRGTLPRRDTEIVILRVACISECEYEWRHHERIGQSIGLSRADVDRVRSGPGAEGWSPRQRALLQAVDDMHSKRREISDGVWTQLAAELSDKQLIELCLLIGHYEMLAMTLRSLRIQPDL
jgi:alkylhydroperoxidase family enzyme